MLRRIPSLALLVLLAATLPASEMDVILRAGGLASGGPPELIGDTLLLSYAFPSAREGAMHSVQAAFAHEQWAVLHPYSRNRNGVYVLTIERPTDTELRYRIVVDGLWTTDPSNPETVTDAWGVAISRLSLPPARPPAVTPVVLADGALEFRLRAQTGSRVMVVGSFNGWDPYMTELPEVASGEFVRRMRLPPGDYYYYFVVNGRRSSDPTNPSRRWQEGLAVSAVTVR